ncbi:hypothetical protein CDAR_444631 [Caerostris darwini]|uniref:Uncharacterized protein n=1 Tax=Caerostris darwini TaxID=1538125 RepID=A0AAV4W5Z0_9ARAC|nr:hypothetical protein CDAR_444631 [Caerostris darwini]
MLRQLRVEEESQRDNLAFLLDICELKRRRFNWKLAFKQRRNDGHLADETERDSCVEVAELTEEYLENAIRAQIIKYLKRFWKHTNLLLDPVISLSFLPLYSNLFS